LAAVVLAQPAEEAVAVTSRRVSVYVAAWLRPVTSTVWARPGVRPQAVQPLVVAVRSQIFLPVASSTENLAGTPPEVAISWKTSAPVCPSAGMLRHCEKTPSPVVSVAFAPSAAKLPAGSTGQSFASSVRWKAIV
jgi:hypothetical protein